MRKLIFDKHFNVNFVKMMTRWHLNYYLFGKGTPISAGVLITDGCNCRCIMCDVWKNKEFGIYPREAQFRDIDDLERIGCYYYSISGGEPTLAKDLPDRLAYAARKLPYVHLVTNGLTMTPELARTLGSSGIKEISLSIDGSEKLHNLMRGRPNAFEKTWRALDYIRTYAPKLQVVVNSVLTPHSLEGLEELGKSLDSFPGVIQKYLPLTFHEILRTSGQQSLPIEGEQASPEKMEEFLLHAVNDSRIINSPAFLKKAILYFKGRQNLLSEQRSCLYQYHSIDFDAQGTAYPCITGMGFKNGRDCNTSLREYLNSPTYRNQQKNLKACARCNGSFMLCYYEPRLNFPIHNMLSAMVRNKLGFF
ncbi:MAG: radical SAM protein [bacterium]